MPPQRSSSHTPAGDSILDRNLAALSRTNPTLADLVRRTSPRPDVRFIETGEGALSAEIGSAKSTASIRLHESVGFKPAGFLPSAGMKPGGEVDVVLLQRALLAERRQVKPV